MPPQVPHDQAEFVQAVMDKLGLSKTDLGAAMGRKNAYADVQGWITGRSILRLDETLRMLEMCGWISPDGKTGVRADPLESLADAVGVLAEGQKKMLALLESRPVAQPRKRPAAPTPRRAG